MKVLVISLGRTGSRSMKSAIECLIPGKCYHIGHPDISDSEHLQFLKDHLNSLSTQDIFRAFFKQYSSTCGSTVAAYWHELVDMYPDAKIILLKREQESWYRSMKKTVLDALTYYNSLAYHIALMQLPNDSHYFVKYVGTYYKSRLGLDLSFSKEEMIKWYNDFYESVESELSCKDIPYLNYDIRDGWPPLCKFLKVPVPEIIFPRNDTKTFYARNIHARRNGEFVVNIIKIMILTMIGCFVYWALFHLP